MRGRRQVLAAVPAMLLAAVTLTACSADSSGPQSSAGRTTAAPSARPSLSMVVLGDSIPFNSPADCPGCKGFVDRYSASLEQVTHRRVVVQNLSQHTGLTLPELLDELPSFQARLAAADVIVIGIAHNSNELAADTPCGAPTDAQQLPDWTKMTSACATRSVSTYRPQYDQLFQQVVSWRAGKPTLLRTLNRYDDWRGDADLGLGTDELATVTQFISTWDTMLCASARAAGFGCADLYRAFNGPDGQAPSGDLLGADYTHPSDKGNALIAKVLTGMGYAPLA